MTDKALEYWKVVIEPIFKEIQDILPFENLRNDHERGVYLVCTQSKDRKKYIGMTVSYMERHFDEVREMGFGFDSLLFKEGEANEIDILSAFLLNLKKIEKMVILSTNIESSKFARHG
jgi:hypothetical protein